MQLDIEKIKIEAPNHGGAVMLVYFNGYLVMYDTINITGNFRIWYLKNIPTTLDALDDFKRKYAHKGIKVTTADVTFEEFWEAFNNKINAKRCVPIWKKIGRKKRLLARYRIFPYDYYLSQKGTAKLNPETYLRDERFNDEAW